MPEKERNFIPENTFDVNVKIKDLNYTNDLSNVRILSSILSPYQIVELNLLLDPNDIILENLYGKDPIKVNLRVKGKGDELLEQIDLDLMMLDTDYELTNKTQISNEEQVDKQPFLVRTVCRKPFETMTTMVNEVYEESTVRDILNDLVKSKAGAKLKFDSNGENTSTISQVVVPPTTLYKIIKENNYKDSLEGYLDKQFGYFEGVPFVFCRYDNTVQIKNLTSNMNKGSNITIHHLASERNNEDIINDSISGKTFYTYSPIQNTYSGNKKLSILSNNVNYINKPTDSLFKKASYNMNDIANKYSLNPSGKKVQINQSVGKRKRYNVDCVSLGDECETANISNLARIISDLSSVNVGLERDIQLTNLLEIGESAKLKTQTAEYSDLSGKYILGASIIDLNRGESDSGTQWDTVARIKLIRTVV